MLFNLEHVGVVNTRGSAERSFVVACHVMIRAITSIFPQNPQLMDCIRLCFARAQFDLRRLKLSAVSGQLDTGHASQDRNFDPFSNLTGKSNP